MFNFNIHTKVFFTFLLLFLYLILRSISLPGIQVNELVIFNHSTLLELADILAGSSVTRYSVLALNIVPTILTILLIQVFSILDTNMNESTRKRAHNVLLHRYNNLFFYIFMTISFISSVFYLEQINLREVSILRENTYLYILHYISCIILLIIGSFCVFLLIQLINTFGIGKGFSVIILYNIILTLNSLTNEYINRISFFFICVVCLQCIVTAFLLYRLDYTYIMIPLQSSLTSLFAKKETQKTLYSHNFIITLSTLSIFPIIITDSMLFVIRSGINNIYDVIIYLTCQIIVILIIYTITSRLLKKTTKLTRHSHRNNILIYTWARAVDSYFLISTYLSGYYMFELLLLISIIVASKMVFIVIEFVPLCQCYLDNDMVYAIYTYNNQFMLMYLISIRLFLFILNKSNLEIYKKTKAFFI